eukprot:4657960-Pyramimonas_sp.AAC.1
MPPPLLHHAIRVSIGCPPAASGAHSYSTAYDTLSFCSSSFPPPPRLQSLAVLAHFFSEVYLVLILLLSSSELCWP